MNLPTQAITTAPAGATAFEPDVLERSTLYRDFLAEREEIMRHKWLESERAGRDIGFEQALVNWVVHHRAKWRQARRRLAAPAL